MNNLTLEQRSEFLKALWIVASYCQDDDDLCDLEYALVLLKTFQEHIPSWCNFKPGEMVLSNSRKGVVTSLSGGFEKITVYFEGEEKAEPIEISQLTRLSDDWRTRPLYKLELHKLARDDREKES
jgi:hypothetical protein